MTYTPFNDDDTYRFELPDLWERTPPPGLLDRECTQSVICPSLEPENIVHERSSSLHRHQSNQLGFYPVAECGDGSVWDGQFPDSIHYLIE